MDLKDIGEFINTLTTSEIKELQGYTKGHVVILPWVAPPLGLAGSIHPDGGGGNCPGGCATGYVCNAAGQCVWNG